MFLNAALTLTGTPTTNGFSSVTGQTVALIQNAKLTDWVSIGEVIRPLGVQVQATTTITVTAPIYQLQRAPLALTAVYASPSAGAVVTGTLLVAGSAAYYAFSNYVAPTTAAPTATNFIADAAGDIWAVKVSTSPTAGAANIQLHYVLINVAGISDAATTL